MYGNLLGGGSKISEYAASAGLHVEHSGSFSEAVGLFNLQGGMVAVSMTVTASGETEDGRTQKIRRATSTSSTLNLGDEEGVNALSSMITGLLHQIVAPVLEYKTYTLSVVVECFNEAQDPMMSKSFVDLIVTGTDVRKRMVKWGRKVNTLKVRNG